MAKELRKIELPTGTYYIDWRLLQVRNVGNPHDFISFEGIRYMKEYLSLQTMKERMVLELTA